MFRHDIREKPVLYKEILKAISKRELLEDLCFCACRKDHMLAFFAWQVTWFALVALRLAAHNTASRIPSFTVQRLCHLVTGCTRIIRHGVNHLCAAHVM